MSSGKIKGTCSTDDRAAARQWRVAEFFAGIGLAGVGMEKAGLSVVWSNDIACQKHEMYELEFGRREGHAYVVDDLANISRHELPTDIDVAWASFPCTDLSIAGGRAGLHRGAASSAFWHFIKAVRLLTPARPPVIALENVSAFSTSNSGRDIVSAIKSLNGLGYSVDVISIDARHFLPQSRPRLFLIGALEPGESDDSPCLSLRPKGLDAIFSDPTLRTHRRGLPVLPPSLVSGLGDYLEPFPDSDKVWWPAESVQAFVGSLSDLQLERFSVWKDQPDLRHRTAYRRMRGGVARWEVRNDEIAGCLRTSSGGSSRQAVL